MRPVARSSPALVSSQWRSRQGCPAYCSPWREVGVVRWSPAMLTHGRGSVRSYREPLEPLMFLRGSTCGAWIVGWGSIGFIRFPRKTLDSIGETHFPEHGKHGNVANGIRKLCNSLKVGRMVGTGCHRQFHWKTGRRADLKVCYI